MMHLISCQNVRNFWTIVLVIVLFSCHFISSSASSSSSPSSLVMKKLEKRETRRSYWSTILNKALELKRSTKWNEFVEEEQRSKLTNRNGGLLNQIASLNGQRKLFNQSFIDETRDPNSPFYIATISSNTGGGGPNLANLIGQNRTKINGTSFYSVNSSNHQQSGFISKLFNYAFSTAPSRVLQTTKRPLITYINISNLEDHDNEDTRTLLNPLEPNQLPLLNNADSNLAALQVKKKLPECATQQVCSAHYVRSNHTQKLCECSQDFKWNCEHMGINEEHIIDLTRRQELKQRNGLEAYTQVKLCENLKNLKPCKTPTDWTIMALQSERTGKSHYVVVCKCPEKASFEGPFTHKHPPYARFPGIRVYGMLCNQGIRKSKNQAKDKDTSNNNKKPNALEIDPSNSEFPEFPWELAYAVINSTTTQGFW